MIKNLVRAAMTVLALSACGDGGGANADAGTIDAPQVDAAPEVGPIARYEVPEVGPPDWGVAPFPSDLHMTADGRVDLGTLPSNLPIWDSAARHALEQRRGVCATCPIYFPVDAGIDPATLQATGAIVMLDLLSGEPVSIEVEWQATELTIAIRPRRGVVLSPQRRYVAALTNAVRAPDGHPLRADPMFAAARDGVATTPPETRIAQLLEPAFATLSDAGVTRATVVSAAVVTVDDTPAHVLAIRDVVAAHYAAAGQPAPIVDQIWRASDGTLDELMGVPSEDRPGFDNPPAPGIPGDIAIAHTRVAIVIAGRFPAPRIVEGSGAELGRLRRDAAGALEAGPAEDVRFVLAIPAGVDVTSLPVVVVHGGGTTTLDQTLYLADTAARAGAAMIALEHFQHGSRSPSGIDVRHGLRGFGTFLGPDGLYEHDPAEVRLRLLGIPGAPGGVAGDPGVVLANFSQMISDLQALFHLVRAGDLSAIAAAEPTLAGLAFDPDRTFFFGISMGTIVGLPTLVINEDVDAAVLSGAIDSFLGLMTEIPARSAFLEFLAGPIYGLPEISWEPDRRMGSHVLVGLMEWVLCPTMPAALAPHLYGAPLGVAPRPDLLVQLGDLDEGHGIPTGDTITAALGIPGFGTFEFAEVAPAIPPLHGNLIVAGLPVTAGTIMFTMSDNYMTALKFTQSNYLPPVAPPFEMRPMPLMYENPIVAAHDQLVHFWQTRATTGRAEIIGP